MRPYYTLVSISRTLNQVISWPTESSSTISFLPFTGRYSLSRSIYFPPLFLHFLHLCMSACLSVYAGLSLTLGRPPFSITHCQPLHPQAASKNIYLPFRRTPQIPGQSTTREESSSLSASQNRDSSSSLDGSLLFKGDGGDGLGVNVSGFLVKKSG